MPVRHINMKQPDIDRLNRLAETLSLTQPGVIATALRLLEEKEVARKAVMGDTTTPSPSKGKG